MNVTMILGRNVPGFYAGVVNVNGVRSTVISALWMTQVAEVRILEQPRVTTNDGVLLLGNYLEHQPVVGMFDANGNPLQGYHVNAVYGTDEMLRNITTSSEAAPILADIATGHVRNLVRLSFCVWLVQ